jgi:hypothetical protein
MNAILKEAYQLLNDQLTMLCPQSPKLTKWQRFKLWIKGEKPEPMFKIPVGVHGTIHIRKPARYGGITKP